MEQRQHVEPSKLRSVEFWSRATTIYAGYKLAQAQAAWLQFRGYSTDYIEQQHWEPHHDRTGRAMYQLCVEMRGFYIKVIRLRLGGVGSASSAW